MNVERFQKSVVDVGLVFFISVSAILMDSKEFTMEVFIGVLIFLGTIALVYNKNKLYYRKRR